MALLLFRIPLTPGSLVACPLCVSQCTIDPLVGRSQAVQTRPDRPFSKPSVMARVSKYLVHVPISPILLMFASTSPAYQQNTPGWNRGSHFPPLAGFGGHVQDLFSKLQDRCVCPLLPADVAPVHQACRVGRGLWPLHGVPAQLFSVSCLARNEPPPHVSMIPLD